VNTRRATANVWLAALCAVTIPACGTGTRGSEAAPPGEATAASEVRAEVPAELRAALATSQIAKLLASDGGDFDELGISVAVSGNTALVGAVLDDDRGDNAGAAYVFVRSGATWVQQAKLTASDGAANDNFGISVALSGDTAVIGAIFNDAASSDTGAAYVFVRSGTSWIQQAKLTASDGASDDQLGMSVAIAGDTAVVGTVNDDDLGDRSGAAYVFVRAGASWTQQAKLTATDGAAADQFGISVAVSGDTAVVGAYGDDDLGASSGSAYVFVRTGTSWSQQAKLNAADGAAIDEVGISVAVEGDTALVGAVFHEDRGAAYVFVRTGTSWSQQAELTASDAAQSDNFGNAVALSGNTAVIGAPNDSDLGAGSGSVYVFERTGTSWSQQAKLTAADGASTDFFGISVALSGTTAVVGAIGVDERGSSAGAAYVFATAASTGGGACSTNAECSSGFCTDGVCCNTACGGGDPTDCQACSVAAGGAVDGTCGPAAAATICRASAGACDVPDHCTGSSMTCPADGRVPSGAVCRAAANSCDLVETCSASSAACPANRFKPDLSLCHGLLGLPGVCLAHVCVL
jgi:FG-GAP repeat